jgi:hypothetical protein
MRANVLFLLPAPRNCRVRLRRTSTHTGLLVLVSLASLVGQVTFARLILDQPLPVAKDSRRSKVTFVPLSKETVAPSQVQITIERTPERSVLSQAIAGTVTTVPGRSIACSTSAIAVDGIDRPLMCGAVPLWRTIDWGSTGVDVVALRGFLRDRGYDVAERPSYDAGLEAAIRGFRKDVGLPAGSSFDVSFVLYSSEPIELSAVSVAVGDRIEAGGTLGRTGGSIVRASMAAEAYPVNERVVAIGANTYDIRSESAKTWVLLGDLSAIDRLGSPVPTTIQGSKAAPPQTVQGTAKFSKPKIAWSVPLTSVRSTGDKHCVFTLTSTGQPSAQKIEIIDTADASVNVTGVSGSESILTFESDAGTSC